MGRYLARRLLQFIPTVLATMFLLHYLTSVGIQFSGNPVRALFGDRTPPESVLENLTERLGLGDPCLQRRGDPCLGLFVDRMEGIFLHWDFGVDFGLRPVTELIAERIPYTAKVVVIAIIFEAVIGITAGVLAGLRKDGFVDQLVKLSTVVFIATPVFVLGFVVREFVGVKFGNVLRGAEWIPDWISHGVFSPGFKTRVPMGQPGDSRARARRLVVGNRRPADAHQHPREQSIRLCANGESKGTQHETGHRRTHAAQLVDPGRDLPRNRPRHADGRSADHRDDLQHPRHRPPRRAGGT